MPTHISRTWHADAGGVREESATKAGYRRLSYVEREQEYPRSQEVAETCAFLGADGLRVPSARDVTETNLVVFCEQPTVVDKRLIRRHGEVEFAPG